MLIIDRFEGEYALIETDDKMLQIPKSLLPPDAQEGDVLQHRDGQYLVDQAATKARKEEISRLMKGIWGN